MPLTPAEKQRRYRERLALDPQRQDDYLRKERQRWHSRKAIGKVNSVSQLNDREHRRLKKYWRSTKADYRRRQREVANLATPPLSPVHIAHGENQQQPSPSARSNCRRRNRKKLINKIEKLTKELEKQKRETEKFKKRWQREKKEVPDTPRKKTMKLLCHASTEILRKKLLMHHVLVEQIKKKYKAQKKERQRRTIAKVVAGSLVKKYKLQKHLQTELGLSTRRNLVVTGKTSRKHYSSTGKSFKERITRFYLRDDNSRMAAGKRETKTKNKEKQQKRFLNDTMKNLHAKFLAEYAKCKISYTLFSRLRPFWVVRPTERDRQTCLCKLHENIEFVVSKLHALKVLTVATPDDLVEKVTCNIKSKNCMYGACNTCRDPVYPIEKNDINTTTTWKRWVTVKETRTIKDVPKSIVITMKEEVEGTIGDLIDTCKSLVERYKKHSFNIIHQHEHYRNLKQNMGENECLIHVDFAENYACKHSSEVQSMHFGASKSQITLHTGVAYVGSNAKATSFCTISDSLQHGPAAIWAYLDPLLNDIQSKHQVDTLHIFSDGPTTQYRQRGNFFLFTRNMTERGFVRATWNFSEAGHGKGAPDGIGAAVKRHADRVVLQGKDMINARSLFNELSQNTSINMYLVETETVESHVQEFTSLKLPSVPGTMALHQILWDSNHGKDILYRDISCMCAHDHFCDCYEPKLFHFPTPEKKVTTDNANQETDDNVSAVDSQTESREAFFADLLRSLQSCKTFASLMRKCKKIDIPYTIDACQPPKVKKEHIDQDAMKLKPTDVDAIKDYVPVKVGADGDCLPHSGSFLAFGNDGYDVEIRARIIVELAANRDVYLDESHLQRGIDCSDPKHLTTSYCMYSGEFEVGSTLTPQMIKKTYEKEVLAATKRGEYMGIFQMFALASILGTKLFSVYPNKGNPNVRKDLNRLLHPRCAHEKPGSPEITYVMWTTTRKDMLNPEYFVPNHFVPLVPCTHESDLPQGTENNSDEIPDDPAACINRYVVVLYDGQPFPGLVVDVDEVEIEVKCLHKIGHNRFFWPAPIEDKIWYSMDQLVAIIPEPQSVTQRHVQVDPPIWEAILKKLP